MVSIYYVMLRALLLSEMLVMQNHCVHTHTISKVQNPLPWRIISILLLLETALCREIPVCLFAHARSLLSLCGGATTSGGR